MANSDKNILITPSVGLSTNPTIRFNGANNTPTTLRVLDDGTISFEGTAGQLFSISDGLTGSIFSVNDISGIPSIEVLDTGLVKVNQYSGSTVFGASAAIQNSSSVNAKVSISTVSASTPGLIIKGAASQTASLVEWHNSAGNVLSFVGTIGQFGTSATVRGSLGGIFGGNTQLSSAGLTVYATAAGNPAAIIRGAASQTANLQEWQDSAGTALSYIKSDGSLHFTANSNAVLISGTSTSGLNRIISNGNDLFFSPYFDGLFAPANSAGRWRPASDGTSDLGSSGQRWKDLYATSGTLTNNSTSKVGLIVKAIASQTANLQEWQLSNNFSVLRVLSGGSMLFGNTNVDSNNYLSFIKAGGAAGGYAGIRFGNDVDGSNQQTLTVNTGNAHLVLEHKNASGAFIIKGAASQTADLQQWYNSNGTLMAAVKADGGFRAGGTNGATKFIVDQFGTLSLGADRGGNPTYLFVQSQLTTDVGAVIKGASGQSANLQEWQDSSGTVLTRVRSDGMIFSPKAFGTRLFAGSEPADWTNYSLYSYSNSASLVTLGIQGNASQTADLTQWKNGSGTVLAKVDKDGNFTANNITDTDWISVSSFSNGYSGYGSIAYRKLNGVVYLRGAVSGGTADTTAFNLPAGYRPSADHVVPVQKYGTTDLNHVTIYTNGDVRPNSTAAWLSSVNYPA